MDINQLPQDIQAALPQNQPANNGPVIPGTSIQSAPTQGNPQDVAAPAIGGATAVGAPSPNITGADLLANSFFNHLLEKDRASQPQRPAGGGSFSDKLRGAMNNVGASFGDSAGAGSNLAPGEGAMTGVARTMAARHDRMAAEHKAKQDETHQKLQDQILTAKNNMEMAVGQQRLQNEKQDFQDRAYARNNASVAQQEKDGYTVEHGVTENDLQQRMKDFKGQDGQHWTDLYDARPSGEITVNGKSVPTYNVVTLKNEPVTLSDVDRASIKANGGSDFPEGTKVSYPAYRAMMNKAEAVADGRAKLEEANGKALKLEQRKLVDTASASPEGQTALSKYPEDRVRGVFEAWGTATDHVKHGQQLVAAAQQHGDPAAIKEAQQYLTQAQGEQKNLHDLAVYGFDKDAIAQHDAITKDRETERHNRADEVNKANEIAQKKTADATSNLQGNDYLQTLPTAQRGMVQAIGEGRQVLPANRKEALALLEQVHQAYPDYDEKAGKNWQGITKEYSQGKTGAALVRANTALEHAKALYDETTANAVLNPLSDEHQHREVTLRLLSDEIGAAIKGGVVAQEEGKDMLARLGGGMTPGLKRERIKEVVERLHDRIEAQQDMIASKAPSSAVKVPHLMTPRGAAAYDYVHSGGQQQTQQPAQAQPPAAQTPKVGDTITQNGRTMKVTSVENGKVTGAH